MKYIALSHAIYLSKISNTELILINIIEEIISSSTLLSFIRKEEEGWLIQSWGIENQPVEYLVLTVLELYYKENHSIYLLQGKFSVLY